MLMRFFVLKLYLPLYCKKIGNMSFQNFAQSSSGGGVFSALVNGIFNMISLGMQNRMNKKADQRTWAREDQVYARERQDALADWNMQNEYNSPKAQMERYQEAGLNPNLIYGSSGDNSAAALSSPSLDSSASNVGTAPDFSGMINTYLQAKAAQDDVTFRNRAMRLQEDKFAYSQYQDSIFNPYKIEKYQLENFGTGLDNTNKNLDIEYKQEDRPYQFTVVQNQAAESWASLQLAQEQVELARQQGKLNDANMKLILAQQRKTNQEIRNLQTSRQLTESQTNKLNSEVEFLNETFFDRKQVLKFDGKMAYLDYNMLFEKSMSHKETLDLETRLQKAKVSLAEFANENKELFQYGKFFMDVIDTGLDVVKPTKK